jgi:hypothetical protein
MTAETCCYNLLMNHTERLKEILSTIKFASMATVNEDGSPHNSPLVFLYDQGFKYIYWGSHPDAKHSQNIIRTGQAFFAAYDSREGKVGVYIQTSQGKMVEDQKLELALQVHNHFRAKRGNDLIDLNYYQGNNPQRMWQAAVQKVWMNAYERDEDGKLVKDYKVEVNLDELKEMWG